MSKAQMFAQLVKIDPAQRLVYGRMCQEVADPGGEVFDYASSKPYFEKWSQETSDATGGKSLGNVRAMHQPVAAGKVTEMTFHDDERAIDICTKVVDDAEWTKVEEGVYTGFSIGGDYVKKWKDGEAQRYTANPIEVSLVDKPMIPTAMFFDVMKADGTVMRKAFKSADATDPAPGDAPVSDAAAADAQVGSPAVVVPAVASGAGGEAEARDPDTNNDETHAGAPAREGDDVPDVQVDGTAEEVLALGAMMTTNKLSMSKVLAIVKAHVEPAHAVKLFADPVNKKYPLDNDAQILAAWNFAHQDAAITKYDPDALDVLRANISAAWESKHGEALKAQSLTTAQSLSKAAEGAPLAKSSFYSASWLAGIVSSLTELCSSVYWDAEYAEDDAGLASLAGDVQDILIACTRVLIDLVSNLPAAEFASEGDAVSLASLPAMRKLQHAVKVLPEARKARAAAAMLKYAKEWGVKVDAPQPDTALTKRIEVLEAQLAKVNAQPRPARVTLKVAGAALNKTADSVPAVINETPSLADVSDVDIVRLPNGDIDITSSMIKYQHRLSDASRQASNVKP